MPVDAVSNQAAGLENVQNSRSTSTGADRATQKSLGQDDFFKLLTTQLASQDPLEPMEDTAFIAQMANFSELEMTSQLTKSFEAFTNIQQFSAAQGYIGKTVTLATGEIGEVTSVERQDGETLVFFDGKNTDGRDINSIYRVETKAASGSGSAASSDKAADAAAKAAAEAASTVAKAFVGPLEKGESREGIEPANTEGTVVVPTRPTGDE